MQHDFNLAANASQKIDVSGTFFKYKTGTGLLRIRTNKGGYIDLLPGQGVDGEDFTYLEVQDKTGAANSGVILAGQFNFRDERISGQVEVINGERARTLADKGFVAYINVQPAAGFAPYVQLWNPVGSGKNLIVERIYISSSTTQAIRIGVTAQLPTVVGAPQNKRVGSAGATVAEARVHTGQAPGVGTVLYNVYGIASQAQSIQLSEPIVIAPGNGLSVCAPVLNSDLPTNIEYYEEPI